MVLILCSAFFARISAILFLNYALPPRKLTRNFLWGVAILETFVNLVLLVEIFSQVYPQHYSIGTFYVTIAQRKDLKFLLVTKNSFSSRGKFVYRFHHYFCVAHFHTEGSCKWFVGTNIADSPHLPEYLVSWYRLPWEFRLMRPSLSASSCLVVFFEICHPLWTILPPCTIL